ncbi:MAG: saccharopine dehydrogenase [Thermoanaerobaculaceae bacterium]|nr:saccharopine dehydrogenase [Thermoanaerobaculaceae bacterium]
MRVAVLGAGRVGNAIARDLHSDKNLKVEVFDNSQRALDFLKEKGIKTKKCDLNSKAGIEKAVKDADLVVGALPGFMGFQCVKNVIFCKKDIVDISFFPEDPFLLEAETKRNKVTCIVDAGIAPGCSNLIAGRMMQILDEIDSMMIYVGGLPVERKWPYEYKAPFSPIDVIEEYTRPARIVKNGKIVEMEALSESELINFNGIGTLEAFNTDGLRTLLKTVKAKNMAEKTLRYLGHIEKMKVLRETGFFSKEKIEVDGKLLRPLDITAKLLFPLWSFSEGEEDITVLRIEVKGKINKKNATYKFELYDKMDTEKGISSMARTTGYTATAIARLVLSGKFKEKGVFPPELIGSNIDNYLFVMKELGLRGVVFKETAN